ncbi:MAG: DUF1569 domain-containing protein [Planctomycetota bacterium]
MGRLRRVTLQTFDEVIDDVTRLRTAGYAAGGRWNLSQVCDHLTGTMRLGLDGDQPRVAWAVRKAFGVLLAVILARRAMVSGAPTLPRLTPEALTEDDPQRIDRCLATLAEARDFAGPLPPYPLCDNMTLDKWKRLMVIHAQHHLGFLGAPG